jgi:hypothetical protein
MLRRKCACSSSPKSGECEECKKNQLQRTAAGAAGIAAAPPIVHDVLRSPGKPLDASTRSFFEPRFGHDFSKVRVHTDDRAAASARAVNATAYTVGHSVVFDRGQFAPSSNSGRKLLAHELTHVMQQSASGRCSPPASSLEIGPREDPSENQAEELAGHATGPSGAHRFASSQPLASRSMTARLQRQAGSGSGEDEPKKEPPPLIRWGDYGIDFKPTIPGPINAPSLEDVHKAHWKLTHKDKPADITCPTGWQRRYGDRCCPGESVDVDRCCPVERITALGRCCPDGQTSDGMNCVPDKDPSPPDHGDEKAPDGKTNLKVKLPPLTPPLTLDFAIHFNQGQPQRAVASEKALRDSLTGRGKSELDTVLTLLKRDTNFSVQLTGMASVEGTPAQNSQLGNNRARSLAYVLMASGLNVLRFSDPPGLDAPCTEIGVGLHNCGDSLAAKSVDENDRQVRIRMFMVPEGSVVSATKP